MPTATSTRGRTRSGRLAALDAFAVRHERALLSAEGDAPFVDVGFGEHPVTTLESAAAFRELNPGLHVFGLESDPRRALEAKVHDDARTRFLHGGFEDVPQGCRLLRVMNVLRGYHADEARRAHEVLGQALIDGGLLMEGSASSDGALLSCHLLRRRDGALVREALLFFTDFSQGFAPLQFRDWLPRDLRRDVRPGQPIFDFFQTWTRAWAQARADGADTPQGSFVRSVRATPGMVDDGWLVENGYALWRPAAGVPEITPR